MGLGSTGLEQKRMASFCESDYQALAAAKTEYFWLAEWLSTFEGRSCIRGWLVWFGLVGDGSEQLLWLTGGPHITDWSSHLVGPALGKDHSHERKTEALISEPCTTGRCVCKGGTVTSCLIGTQNYTGPTQFHCPLRFC